ncbi:MAG: hypothetical protein JWL64_2836 [Frankiales bacterium]|nr:hypothetical protein [Frankiales bacterium]
MRHRPAGRRAALLQPDGDAPAAVAVAVRLLAAQAGVALEDVVPGAETVLVVADGPVGLARLLAALPDLAGPADLAGQSGPPLWLAARYDGPDLGAVAEGTGLAVDEVVRRHSAVTYRAAFGGFAPGFAYLAGLDPALVLPRRATPRTAVPAGSLAIADAWTAVYPRSSPGGWHLLGTVDTPMFDLDREPAALIRPGQLIRFVPA